jgi:tripartite ATP-independent transporter DctP family solute receptor
MRVQVAAQATLTAHRSPLTNNGTNCREHMKGAEMRIWSHATSRRTLLTSGAALGLSVMAPHVSRGQSKVRLKLAMASQPTNPIGIRSMEAIKRISEETNGDVTIQLFGSGQLGAEPDVLNQVRMGAVDMFNVSTVILSTVVPQSSISGVGFAFRSYDDVWKAMDGDLGAYIRSQMGQANLVGFHRIWDFGFRQLTSASKPIKTPADLVGFKIRVPSGPLWTSLFKALGAAPTTVQIAEVYSALRTGLIDGTDLPLLTMTEFKIPEVQKCVSLTNHMWDGPWMLANKGTWERLPPSVTAVIEKHFNASALDQREDVRKYDQAWLGRGKDNGLTIVEADGKAFRAKLQAAGFYADWKQKFGADSWSTLEKYSGGGV